MAVYLISAHGTEYVKIGESNKPARRMADLQAGTFHELRLLRTWEGKRGVEHWLHTRYADRHVIHEWYRFCPEMMTIEPTEHVSIGRIGTLEQIQDQLIATLKERPDLTYFQIADALDVPRSRIGNWINIVQPLGRRGRRGRRAAA